MLDWVVSKVAVFREGKGSWKSILRAATWAAHSVAETTTETFLNKKKAGGTVSDVAGSYVDYML